MGRENGMLDKFIIAERREILSRTKSRVVLRTGSKPDLPDGIPAFLDQLVTALRLADSTDTIDHDRIRESAGKHGDALLRMGFSVEEVVHEYGDVCQTITELAIEREVRVPTAEFRVMNLCLDDAIAEAVTEFAARRELANANPGTEALGKLAHELRHLLATVKTSFDIIKRGQVAPGGSTGKLLERSLLALGALIERAIADADASE
jgi:hypothetical protein